MMAYIDRFLALLERFVIATEQRNKILASQKTTIAQDVAHAEKSVSAAESTAQQSASNGSANAAATETRGRGRSRASVAGSDATADAGTQQPADTGAAAGGRRERSRAGSATESAPVSSASTGGRRERVRANATEQQAAGTESSAGATTGGRRERVRAGAAQQEEKKPDYDETIPEPVNDTPEQADDRAEIENVIALCGDVDQAAAEVKDYLKNNGWTGAESVPSHQLEDVLADVNEIADKYFD